MLITVIFLILILELKFGLFHNFSKKSSALVIKVIDGDTIVIESGERVRLLGIDAPEKGENYYKEAKERLEDLILFKNVTLESYGRNRDKYGRLLRYIWVNEENINIKMIKEGFAFPYIEKNTKYKDELIYAAKTAMLNKSNLWKARKKFKR